MTREETQHLQRRDFLAWLCKIGGGAAALTLTPDLLPLRRVNTVLFGGMARAQEACSPDTCNTDHPNSTCQVRDVCDVDNSGACTADHCHTDESGDCENDQCGVDKSQICKNDSCISDASGQCENDNCRGDKSGACLNDRCARDISGACSGDSCPSDKSGACESDSCTSDKSAACWGDSCVNDKSGQCRTDHCRADSSGDCESDVCSTDKSGGCQNDRCEADKSGACMTDRCATDTSAMCGPDTCNTSDASGACANDTCNEDSSSSCANDTCDVDTRICEGDTTNIPSWDCFLDGFCPLDVPCFLDVLGSKNKTAAGAGRKTGAALKWLYKLVAILIFLPFLAFFDLTEAAVYHVAAGDTAGLIAAMEAANANPDADTINLAAGDYVLNAPYIENLDPDEDELFWIVGLPSVVSPITINGSETGVTTILRNKTADDFSIFHVAKIKVEVSENVWEARVGNLTLNRLVIQGGRSSLGGGVFNQEAILSVTRCTIRENAATDDEENSAGGGGIENFFGTVTIDQSTISGNTAGVPVYDVASGGGIENIGGELTVRNTTIYGNSVEAEDGLAAGGGISGSAKEIPNVTIAGNRAIAGGTEEPLALGGGLFFSQGLKNSIVALNTAGVGPDVFASASLGFNLIGNTTAASFFETLASDLINTTPGLGAFRDSGSPGTGHLPVLTGSPALDSGDPAACAPQDQRGFQRVNICERGAVEHLLILHLPVIFHRLPHD